MSIYVSQPWTRKISGFQLLPVSLALVIQISAAVAFAKTAWTDTPVATKQRIVSTYGKLPLSFEANHGQAHDQVKFLSRGRGYTLFLTSDEAVLALRGPALARSDPGKRAWPETGKLEDALRRSKVLPHPKDGAVTTTAELEDNGATSHAVLRMKLVGGNPRAKVSGLKELPGKSYYFIGNDPKQWRTNILTYAKVKYEDVYPGIDLIYYGTNQSKLEYDFIVTPGANPKAIRLTFDGADLLELDARGDLILHITGHEPAPKEPARRSSGAQATGHELRLHKPRIYQDLDDTRQEIAGHYVLLANNEVAFEVAAYDASKPLIIDPVLVFSTYLGGIGFDEDLGLALDPAGSVYVTGRTLSIDFPTASPFAGSLAGLADAFVTKLNAMGTALVYSTYLGGSGFEDSEDIAVDASGRAYVTGFTSSVDFPTVNPIQAAKGGGVWDAYVAKLNPAGSALIYSTYLGGSGTDLGEGIAVDAARHAHLIGFTTSIDFPMSNPVQNGFGGGFSDAFVTKISAAGDSLTFSTYLGGSGREGFAGFRSGHVAVDVRGNVYVTGDTNSTDFPVGSPFQPANAGGFDIFVAKLAPTPAERGP
ncbi:SBBP repeat-containing protein [Acidobacteria bacterium AH-259-A15]|nr:SBBP repeat-containing protein [Acidobacteria bacterium AH-259-A15]